jgi:transposase
VVERLDLSAVAQDYPEEGWPAYAPTLLVNVWLYAYALGTTSCWRLERRVREDRGLCYLAGGGSPTSGPSTRVGSAIPKLSMTCSCRCWG